ncbi:cytochrome c biogenesis CcdA family protein [Candidatus Soleaferrea massiliensis]|uniref:cytochrome c biogenesis CcdA family protein n=1 Tax=Candidatus Soleaferrea massiliensis TaxID=1470354 RepID=UPI00058CE8FD|nr:hypothetical protein [Candidatus Soleaferrea massiliensis]
MHKHHRSLQYISVLMLLLILSSLLFSAVRAADNSDGPIVTYGEINGEDTTQPPAGGHTDDGGSLSAEDTVSVNPDADQSPGEVDIIYYFYNRCLTCEEEKTVEDNIRAMVKMDFPNVTVNLEAYNVAVEENLEKLKVEFQNHDIDEEKLMLQPIVFIGDAVMIGSQELGDNFKGSVATYLRENTGKASKNVSVKYLYADGCSDCEKVNKFLEGITEIEVKNDDGTTTVKPLKVDKINAGDIAEIERINDLYNQHNVKPEEQRVPIILYDGGYLVGYDQISRNLVDVLSSGEGGAMGESGGPMTIVNVLWIALSGLIGGLSPCSMSLILLLFSLLIADRRKVLGGGFGFVVGRVIMYFLLGTVFFGLLSVIDKAVISGINLAIAILVIVIGVIFAVLSLIDFIRAKKGQSGKAILQFPPKMKAFYEKHIEKISTGRALFIAALIAGAIVAVGEFLCTGQLFAATVLYYFNSSAGDMLIGAFVFLIYAVMMSLPAVIVTLLVYKGKKYTDVAGKFANRESLIKLLMFILFLGFTALGVYNLWRG